MRTHSDIGLSNNLATTCLQICHNLHVFTCIPYYSPSRLTRLLSSRHQNVFALLVPRCCGKSGKSCYHLVTRLMTITDLLQVVQTRLIQAVRNKLLRACCHQLVNEQTCWNNLLRVCWPHKHCYKMVTTCSTLANNWEQAVRTHLVDKL